MFGPGGRQHTFSPPPISSLKRRRRLTTDESEFLLHQFGLNERPIAQERDSFAKHLKLDRRTIQVWFQNRRAKLKRDERGGGGEDESEIQEQEIEEIEADLKVDGGLAVVAEVSVLVADEGAMGYGGDPLADWEYLQYACQFPLDQDMPPLPLDLHSHSLR
ncbi:hypothetical protein BGZ58_010205 [Dissophora ornata]|nr:hypothetical protein BGZ58_010205 [Dissophora ornata]